MRILKGVRSFLVLANYYQTFIRKHSKAVGRKDKLDLVFQSIIRGIRPSNVLAAGMSGFQQGDTSQRRSTRLEKKRDGVIVQDLPSTHSNKEWRTASRFEGDVIVLSLDEPSPPHDIPGKATGSIFSGKREVADTETWIPPNGSLHPA